MKVINSFYRILRHYPVMVGLMVIVFICYDLTQYNVIHEQDLALNNKSFSEPWRLFSYSVVHISMTHFLMNLFIVYTFTPYLFKPTQTKRQLGFFILMPPIIGAICALFFVPNNPIGAVGYSGVVFAIGGSLWAFQRDMFKQFTGLMVISTLYWYATNTPAYHAAHFVGYAVGLLYGLWLKQQSNFNQSKGVANA